MAVRAGCWPVRRRGRDLRIKCDSGGAAALSLVDVDECSEFPVQGAGAEAGGE